MHKHQHSFDGVHGEFNIKSNVKYKYYIYITMIDNIYKENLLVEYSIDEGADKCGLAHIPGTTNKNDSTTIHLP